MRAAKHPTEAAFQPLQVPGLAFPYHQDTPSGFAQCPSGLGVALDVASELRIPIFRAAARSPGQPAARVLVPEASVNLDGHAVARKHDVRGSREISPMQPEAYAHRMKKSAHGEFRPSVLLSYGPHYRRREGRAPWPARCFRWIARATDPITARSCHGKLRSDLAQAHHPLMTYLATHFS